MFRLLRYFSLTSFVAMLLVAFLMGFFFRQVEMQNLLRLGEGQNVALTRVFTNSLWPILNNYIRQSNELQFHAIRDNPVVPLLDHTVRHLISELEVTKVKIYNRRGVTIFSTQGDQIGQDQGGNVGVQAALNGQVISNLVHRQGAPSFDGVVESQDLISSYVPLKRNNEVLGVLELYYDISPLLQQVRQTQRQGVVVVLFLFLALYAVLFGIVSRADRIIKEQHQQGQRYVKEIREINQSLEKRVRERTETLELTNKILEAEITERHKAETELHKLSRAVEQSPVSVVITDTRGTIEYVNPKFTQVTGYSAEEVIGQNPRILKSGEMSSGNYDEMWREIRAGHVWRGEFHNRKKNGEMFWELASLSPIRDATGEITHFLAVKEDISVAKAVERSLRNSELRLRTIMENVVEGILLVNAQGIIESANPSVAKIFGFSVEELVGQNVMVLVPGEHKKYHDEYIRKFHSGVLGEHLRFDREIQAERRDGAKFSLELTIRDLHMGGEVHFVATLRDISRRKQTEIELAEARQKYYHQEKMAAIGTLAAGIVHEIGNPIAALSGLMEQFRDSCDHSISDEGHANLDLVQEQINRLSVISRDVSEFSVPRSEEFQLLDLNALIAGTCRLMRFDKRMAKADIHVVLDRELPAVSGSDNQLRQVLINILINAVDAMEGMDNRRGDITVISRRDGDWVELSVRDNGLGMDGETLARAMEAFFTTKSVGKGTGLGLSLCYSIVTGHQGVLQISSVKGEGSQILVRLPVYSEL